MKAKEKASELIKLMSNKLTANQVDATEDGKQCALIAVDEIIKFIPAIPVNMLRTISEEYWEEVKNEIEKLN
jgi:hypothetical protein